MLTQSRRACVNAGASLYRRSGWVLTQVDVTGPYDGIVRVRACIRVRKWNPVILCQLVSASAGAPV